MPPNPNGLGGILLLSGGSRSDSAAGSAVDSAGFASDSASGSDCGFPWWKSLLNFDFAVLPRH
jgi:hypothetical protein